MKNIAVIVALASIFAITVRGQGFLNLNFESAYNLPGDPPVPNGVDVNATNALPDWTAYAGGYAMDSVDYVSNDFSGATTLVALAGGSVALSGDFSAVLLDGGLISQTAMVPADAESLQFEASFAANLYVTLGGQNLSYSILSQNHDYAVCGVDIPAGMDGQNEELTFSIVGSGETLLDNIEFLPTSVPEPGEGAILGLGALLIAMHRRRSLGR